MRRHVLHLIAALGVASCCLPSFAQAKGQMSVGPMLWTYGTNLQVDRATDFDGSNITAQERANDWSVSGAGVGVRLSYDLPRAATLFGEVGTSQATVRDKDITDPAQPVDSRGLDNGAYYGGGVQFGGPFSHTGNGFWSVGGTVSRVSAALDPDITTRWEFDETRLAADGKVGVWAGQLGFYGGVRVVNSDAELRETDRTNPVGQQVRTTELSRKGPVDLLIGAQTHGSGISGFTEVGMVGTLSATAGLSLRF